MSMNEKEKIGFHIEKMKTELRALELSEKEIMLAIASHKALASKIVEQLQTISWKITQAEFIYSYEDKKHSNYLDRLKQSKTPIHKVESFNDITRNESNHPELENCVLIKLEQLRKSISEKRKLIFKKEHELKELKIQSSSLFQDLLNQLEEAENEEKRLEDFLDKNLHGFCEGEGNSISNDI